MIVLLPEQISKTMFYFCPLYSLKNNDYWINIKPVTLRIFVTRLEGSLLMQALRVISTQNLARLVTSILNLASFINVFCVKVLFSHFEVYCRLTYIAQCMFEMLY